MKIKLLRNQVLLQPLPQAKGTRFIYYPQQYQDDVMRYKVVAVGPGRRTKKGVLIPPEVEPGDFVIAPLYLTHILLSDGKKIADADQLLLRWRFS